MKKIHVFANGAEYISVDGVCYKITREKGKVDVDSGKVVVHKTAEDCKKDNS
jgi:hypothetical protein